MARRKFAWIHILAKKGPRDEKPLFGWRITRGFVSTSACGFSSAETALKSARRWAEAHGYIIDSPNYEVKNGEGDWIFCEKGTPGARVDVSSTSDFASSYGDLTGYGSFDPYKAG